MSKSIKNRNIALFYGEKEKVDAMDTLDDLANELESWGFIAHKKSKGKLVCEGTTFSFHDIENSDNVFKKGGFFEKIYMSSRLKEYEFQCVTISEKIVYHPYPFQSLIDMVLEVKGKK